MAFSVKVIASVLSDLLRAAGRVLTVATIALLPFVIGAFVFFQIPYGLPVRILGAFLTFSWTLAGLTLVRRLSAGVPGRVDDIAGAHQELESERALRLRAERDAVWKDLTFVAAHRLGSPLVALETLLRNLSKQRAFPAELQPRLVKAQILLERCKLTIAEFKRAAHIRVLSISTVPLDRLLSDLADHGPDGLDLTVEAPTQHLAVKGDSGLIAECIEELFANAARHNRGKAHVFLSAHGPVFVQRRHAAALPTPFVQIVVADNGGGVPAEHKENIFRPLYTTSKHTAGLGLYIVREAIEAQGGSIVERGEPGAGARFEICLPMCLPENT